MFYDSEISRKQRKIKEIEDKLFEQLSKIEKTGVYIRNDVLYYRDYALGVGIGYQNFKKVLFNNISFDEENLEYIRKVIKCNVLPPEEPFEKRYNEWLAEYSESEEEYGAILEELERISKQKIKTATVRSTIKQLDNRRNVLYNNLANSQARKRKLETFSKLSYEQLELIYNYYELVKELESKNIGNFEQIGIQIAYPTALNKDEIKMVINKMLQSAPYLRCEFLHTKLVILKNYLRYQFDTDSLSKTNISSDNKILIDNFIITVSDEINDLYLEFISNLDKVQSFQKKK